MKSVKSVGIILFIAVALLDITFIATSLTAYRYFTKPLLLPILLVSVLVASRGKKHPVSKFYLVIAYVAGGAGDFLLLRGDQQESYFLYGVVFFAIMQLFFVLYFFRMQSIFKSPAIINFFVAIMLAALAVAFVALMYNYLGNLKYAVSVYSGLIMLMFFAAINVVHSNKASKLASRSFIPGAGFLVLSDVILAVNKFYIQEDIFDVSIMATYSLGQLFFALGFMKHLKSSGGKHRRRSGSSDRSGAPEAIG